MNRVAINLCDLDQMRGRQTAGFNPISLLLHDFVTADAQTTPPAGGRWDEVGVVLDGPAAQDESRVNALVELLQTVIGPRKIHRRVRCYREGPRGGWAQIMPGQTNRQLLEAVREAGQAADQADELTGCDAHLEAAYEDRTYIEEG